MSDAFHKDDGPTVPDLDAETHINIESGVSMFTGEGFCTIAVNHKRIGQLTPQEVRTMALHWLEAAEAACSDAAVYAQLRKTGLDANTAGAFIQSLRDHRDPT